MQESRPDGVPSRPASCSPSLTARVGDLDCSLEDAVTLTPFVVAPAAASGGHVR
jgi:hypothetical protein